MSEARTETQKGYGIYCEMCKAKNIKPIPYHAFLLDKFNKNRDEYIITSSSKK